MKCQASGGAGLRCSIPDLVTYLIRGSLVKHGCSRIDANKVRVDPYRLGGIHPVLACIVCEDSHGREREIHRVYDMEDLNSFIADPIQAAALADAVKKMASR